VASFPLFLVGSPRSGTTCLCGVLNVRPLSQPTNERFARFSRRMLLALAESAATHLGYAAA
jgi:hypothetical protein